MTLQITIPKITAVLDSMNIPYSFNSDCDEQSNPINGPVNNKELFGFYCGDFNGYWTIAVRRTPEVKYSSFKTAEELQLILSENLL